jgi:hypothetical protein
LTLPAKGKAQTPRSDAVKQADRGGQGVARQIASILAEAEACLHTLIVALGEIKNKQNGYLLSDLGRAYLLLHCNKPEAAYAAHDDEKPSSPSLTGDDKTSPLRG